MVTPRLFMTASNSAPREDKKVHFVILLRHSEVLNKWAYSIMTCNKEGTLYKKLVSSTNLKFLHKSECVRAARAQLKNCIKLFAGKYGAEVGQIYAREV